MQTTLLNLTGSYNLLMYIKDGFLSGTLAAGRGEAQHAKHMQLELIAL